MSRLRRAPYLVYYFSFAAGNSTTAQVNDMDIRESEENTDQESGCH